ncbi:UBX domain-containing protein 11 [Geranomyces variabilis]|nr:UBX domain-containing protein 11 [Geranomyces variabilis]
MALIPPSSPLPRPPPPPRPPSSSSSSSTSAADPRRRRISRPPADDSVPGVVQCTAARLRHAVSEPDIGVVSTALLTDPFTTHHQQQHPYRRLAPLGPHRPRMPAPTTAQNGSSTSSSTLLTSMAARLAKSEAERERAVRELQIKEAESEALQAELEWERERRKHGKAKQVALLEARCQAYQQQIAEMERFLHGHHMIWKQETAVVVGAADDGDKGEMMDPPAAGLDIRTRVPLPSYRAPFPFDFPRLLASIRELNVLAGEHVASVTVDGRGTRQLKAPASLPLTLYRNGFILAAGSFRDYRDPAAAAFMRDIAEGYFPYELKPQYPDGVPFEVADRHDDWYTATGAARFVPFTGKGRRAASGRPSASSSRSLSPTLSSSSASSSFSETEPPPPPAAAKIVPVHLSTWTPRTSTTSTTTTVASVAVPTRQRSPQPTALVGARRHQTISSFLAHIPTSTVRGGEIIPIRERIAALLQQHATTAETEQQQRIFSTPGYDDADANNDITNSTVQLRIHTASGTSVLIRARHGDTVGGVKQVLGTVLGNGGGGQGRWELRTALQGAGLVFGDQMTLEECGLRGNTTMYASAQKTME